MLKEYGQDLKKLRESKDITLAEISAQTRINQKFLNSIEEGNFDFQPETYIRSFLKAYARVLDENETVILNDYDKAKSGFYARRKFVTETPENPEEKISIMAKETGPPPKQDTVYQKDLKKDLHRDLNEETKSQTSYEKYKEREDDQDSEYSNKTWLQKTLLVLLILVVIASVVYLINYLNNSGDKKNTNVKPKSFNEISDDYKNKITGKKDSANLRDSTSILYVDSLKLMVKVSKDTRIKAYIDENKIIEEDISAKDSLVLKAKDQFRFSSTGNSSVELYLNGKYLKKPVSSTGLNAIKNLIIKKDGIVSQ